MGEVYHHFRTSAVGNQPETFGISLQKPKFPEYADASKRRESFKTWPEYTKLKPDCLVEAGLLYTGLGDSVRCYHCGGGLRNWEEEDKPWEEHAKWYPICPHVLHVKGQRYVDALTRWETPVENREEEPKHPQYAVVSKRLDSFKTWPEDIPVKPDSLIEAGFLYTGVDDSVICYHCGGGLRGWKIGNKPWEEHAKSYPTCPHVLFKKGQDYVESIRRGETPGENKDVEPKHPQFVVVSKRLDSFKTWPEDIPVKPDSLIEAGFLYTGMDDSVICYHCGGGLRGWKIGNKPWEEHAKSYPTCPHVLFKKGQDYVDSIRCGETPGENKDVVSRDILNTTAAQSCIQNGFSEDTVTKAIAIFTQTNGHNNFNGEDLCKIMLYDSDSPCGEGGTRNNMPNREVNDLLLRGTCVTCSDGPADTVCLPCGHLVCCANCVLSLNTCPVCGNVVKGYFKTYRCEYDEAGANGAMDQEYGIDCREYGIEVHEDPTETVFCTWCLPHFPVFLCYLIGCCWWCQSEAEDTKSLV